MARPPVAGPGEPMIVVCVMFSKKSWRERASLSSTAKDHPLVRPQRTIPSSRPESLRSAARLSAHLVGGDRFDFAAVELARAAVGFRQPGFGVFGGRQAAQQQLLRQGGAIFCRHHACVKMRIAGRDGGGRRYRAGARSTPLRDCADAVRETLPLPLPQGEGECFLPRRRRSGRAARPRRTCPRPSSPASPTRRGCQPGTTAEC